MLTWIDRIRVLFAGLVLTLFAPHAGASGDSPSTSPLTHDAGRTPSGDPDLGWLIIIGAVAFLVLVAWIFSRTGDDGSRGPDRTLL
jgi:hypothetical protein